MDVERAAEAAAESGRGFAALQQGAWFSGPGVAHNAFLLLISLVLYCKGAQQSCLECSCTSLPAGLRPESRKQTVSQPSRNHSSIFQANPIDYNDAFYSRVVQQRSGLGLQVE